MVNNMSVKIKDYFDIKYGINLDFAKMIECENGIPFVSRTEKNNGVCGFVEQIKEITPNPANTISVSCGGTILESFLQNEPYYSGRDLYYLTPKIEFTEIELLFYCMCIKANAFKYSYGRQANKTLNDLFVPSRDEIPQWVYETKIPIIDKEPILKQEFELNVNTWQSFKINDLFKVEKGVEIISNTENGNIPLISSTATNNGITKYINDGKLLFSKNKITVASNGSVGETFYQNTNFYATADVNILTPKFNMNQFIALFLVSIIRNEKYKFDYGRKWGKSRMENSIIKLPIDKNNKPNFIFMENYIKSLNYSKNLE